MSGRWQARSGWLAVAALLFGALATPARAVEGRHLALGAGSYDVARSRAAEAGLELRFGPRRWGLVPAVGATVAGDGAFWAWGGLQRPFRLAPAWLLTPGFAVARYEEPGAGGKDLGGPLEFRSSLELSRRLAGGSSLGLAVYHLSNAGFYDDNPGSNSVVLIWALPLGGP